jgi:hypothetical protein
MAGQNAPYCSVQNLGRGSAAEDSFLIVSYGKDREEEYLWEYNPYDEEAGMVTVFSADDYNCDLINYDGSWIRCPLYKARR